MLIIIRILKEFFKQENSKFNTDLDFLKFLNHETFKKTLLSEIII